jgi:hypothetical protein
MDTNQFGGSFWITFTGLILSFLGGMAMYCLKSKCKTCSVCFGLVQIERDVGAENEQEKMELEKGLSYMPNPQNK